LGRGEARRSLSICDGAMIGGVVNLLCVCVCVCMCVSE
jgi:hypothetical protein